jgi:hypothetical protein
MHSRSAMKHAECAIQSGEYTQPDQTDIGVALRLENSVDTPRFFEIDGLRGALSLEYGLDTLY